MPREYKTTSMKDDPSGSEPRYSYAKPTLKSEPGLPKQLGYKIEEYKLPATAVENTKNFPPCEKYQVYPLEEILKGDYFGTTETDSVTDPKGSGGYSRINAKKHSVKSRW